MENRDETVFVNYEKMRLLEYLTLYGASSVSELVKGVDSTSMKVSQSLKRLRDDGFVVCHREGRFQIYEITRGVHKTAIECIHKRYNSLQNKNDF